MFDFGTISFVKKEIEKQSKKESISHPINLIFSRFLTSDQEQTLMLKLWRCSQTTFLQCFCLFCLPFFGSDILWRGHAHWVSKSLKPSQDSCMCTKQRTHATLQAPALMKCANFSRLKKHIFMQPSCFLQSDPPRVSFRVIGTQLEVCWVFVGGRWYLLATHFKARHVKTLLHII